ncbi:MAG: TonB-dependent receptor, partial [Bacteroidales bacterium]|nr:TonB-dependent receptor [Bacteroidales bacterium]
IGTITDLNGNFDLLGIPEGNQKIEFYFLGFALETREILIKKNESPFMEVELTPQVFQGEEVIITAQARGQIAAINQQLSSNAIINVISSEKLQELPDINAAEAIGRLPGITVQRDGGEGQKVIIRGFEPKYNTVSINGLMAPSTDLDDRSTDLNLVSADIISGIEVMKANTADKDADGLGGNVNLVLKEAAPGKKLNVNLQTGYSGQTNTIGHYKANLFFSNRFFDNKLGMLFSASAESYDRSSDQWEVDYEVSGIVDTAAGETFIKPWIGEEDLKSVIEQRGRYNGSIFLDYKFKNSLIKTSTFFSALNRDYFIREKNYDLNSNYLEFKQREVDQTGLIFSNAIEGKHNLLGTKLDWGIGQSSSMQKQPYNHHMVFRQLSAYLENTDVFNTLPPEEILTDQYVDEQVDEIYLYDGTFSSFETPENETNAWLNWEIPFQIGKSIRGSFKTGTKFRVKNKTRDTKSYQIRFDGAPETAYVESLMPGLEPSAHMNLIGITSFLDDSYETEEFLNGDYPVMDLSYVMQRDLTNDFYELVGKGYYDTVFSGHVKHDYTGYEEIFATYGMFEFYMWDKITFIPGVRMEKTFLEYTAFIGDAIPDDDFSEIANQIIEDTTTSNSYTHFLPQIHLKIKPWDWVDLRLAYTNTLSRPDYTDLAPRMQISPSSLSIKLSGTYLEPVKSENWDAILSFYTPKAGLYTIGLFHKIIDGFVYDRTVRLNPGTPLSPESFGIPDSYAGYSMSYPTNNSALTIIKGFETEIQTNMNFLPAPFNGIVFSGNFTLMDSETYYNETLIQRMINPDYGLPGEARRIFVNFDTAYVDRMLFQARYLANVSLGYDRKGFSARLSFTYTDQILTDEQRRIDGSDTEATLAFYKWDFQLKQNLSEKLSINVSLNNILNQPDRTARLITGYYSSVEYYGMRANIGLKYKFF